MISRSTRIPGGHRSRDGFLFERAVVRGRMSDFQIEETTPNSPFDGFDHKWGLDINVKKKTIYGSLDDLEKSLSSRSTHPFHSAWMMEFASKARVTGYTRPFTYVFQCKGEKESILVWGYARDGVHMFHAYLPVVRYYKNICRDCGVTTVDTFRNTDRVAVSKVCVRVGRYIDSNLPPRYQTLMIPRSKILRSKTERGVKGRLRLQTVVNFNRIFELNPTYTFLRVSNEDVESVIPRLRSAFSDMMLKTFSEPDRSWQNFTPQQVDERRIWIETCDDRLSFPTIWCHHSLGEYASN